MTVRLEYLIFNSIKKMAIIVELCYLKITVTDVIVHLGELVISVTVEQNVSINKIVIVKSKKLIKICCPNSLFL